MGGCCSSDALPDVPEVIIPDPDANTPIKAVVKQIGWGGRDYSVHKDVYPSNKEEVKQKMWMWFNKSNGGIIDLENFVRGWNENEPTKGKTLYSAVVTEVPHFEQFQRPCNHGTRDRFTGFFGMFGNNHNNDDNYNNNSNSSGYDSDDDNYYIRHTDHTSKFRDGQRYGSQPHHDLITKWRLHTRATIRDGNLGRGADVLKGQDVILEVFSKGTAATGWERIEQRHTDEEGREHVTYRDEKRETEWVDRVEFRLSVGGQMWAEWVVQGDSHYQRGTDAVIESPIFRTHVEGGWFSKSTYVTSTKAGIDPALALMVAHLCYTEYSVAEIKNDLRPNTPHSPPPTFMYQPPMQQAMQFGGVPLSGQFHWG